MTDLGRVPLEPGYPCSAPGQSALSRPYGGYPSREELAEMTAVDLVRDAKLLACAPRDIIRHNQAEIEEARELLNDALAKVES